MIVSLDNLENGIQWWQTYVDKWGLDFANAEYYDIYKLRADGITQKWWSATVDHLWDWKAIRAPKPPNTKQEILDRGIKRFDAIGGLFSRLRSISSSEPSIADVTWEEIGPLFDLCFQIKPGGSRYGSPVFASKMCHFIFPKVFPVIDNLATGIFEYEFYWRGMKDEWFRFQEKSEALGMLKAAMKTNGKEVHDRFPFQTKIIELSHIGYAKHKAKYIKDNIVNVENER
jgi:hypothetical protein